MSLRTFFDDTNPEMRSVLRNLERARGSRPAEGPVDAISAVALSPFIQIDGSVFLASCVPAWLRGEKFIPSGSLINRSCWEQAINRLDVSNGFAARHRGPEILEYGIAIAEVLRLKLRASFPRRQFKLHVSWNSKPMFESQRHYELTRKCRVSFWQYRPAETVFAPLSGFRHEAIGEILVK